MGRGSKRRQGEPSDCDAGLTIEKGEREGRGMGQEEPKTEVQL